MDLAPSAARVAGCETTPPGLGTHPEGQPSEPASATTTRQVLPSPPRRPFADVKLVRHPWYSAITRRIGCTPLGNVAGGEHIVFGVDDRHLAALAVHVDSNVARPFLPER
jgi:hypothetical protein